MLRCFLVDVWWQCWFLQYFRCTHSCILFEIVIKMWVPLDRWRKVVVSREHEALWSCLCSRILLLLCPVDRTTSHSAVLFHGCLFHTEEEDTGVFPWRGLKCAVVWRLCFTDQLVGGSQGSCSAGDLQNCLSPSLVSTAATVMVVQQEVVRWRTGLFLQWAGMGVVSWCGRFGGNVRHSTHGFSSQLLELNLLWWWVSCVWGSLHRAGLHLKQAQTWFYLSCF